MIKNGFHRKGKFGQRLGEGGRGSVEVWGGAFQSEATARAEHLVAEVIQMGM